MRYDIFISYTRRDNTNNQVATLVDQIAARFATFAGRPLRPFFDTREIEGGEYWQDKILTGLKESRLMLACLSPGYLESQWCEWEFIEYQKYELGRAYLGKGMAPIYFVTVPGFDQPDFEATCAKWVAELRRRQHYDLRPWHGEGEAALEQLDVAERLDAIIQQVLEQIRLGEQVEQRKGNLDRANDHFVGRTVETQRLHRLVGLGPVGTITAVNGLGGMGKTALALQYAHVYGHLFAGGCWQIRCEGKTDLKEAFASLRGQRDMDYELIEEEKKSLELQFERVLRELKKRAEVVQPTGDEPPSPKQESIQGRVLIILDNVDQPGLLTDEQTRSLPQADWLCLLATTRLGIEDLDNFQENEFLSVDELSVEDGLALVESYQPNRTFLNLDERESALKIVRLLGGLPLAVEVAAVYMGAYSIPCQAFLARLQEDGHDYFHQAEQGKKGKIRHGEKCLALTLQPTLERLNPEERLVLDYASLLPPDQIPLPWLRTLVAREFPACGQDARTGDTDPWLEVVRRLLSFRLLQATGVKDSQGFPLVVRMHRLVGEIVRNSLDNEAQQEYREALQSLVLSRVELLKEGWVDKENRWEVLPLTAVTEWWQDAGLEVGSVLALGITSLLVALAFFTKGRALLLKAVVFFEKTYESDHPILATNYSNMGMVEEALGNLHEARALLLKAVTINEKAYKSDYPILARDYSNLALVEQNLGNLHEAHALLLKAVAIEEKIYKPDHPKLAVRYSNLALVEQNLGNLHEAHALLLKAMAIEEKTYKPDHPKLAVRYSNLALVEQNLGNLHEAHTLLLKAVEIDEKAYESDHPILAVRYSNIAMVERDLGNLAKGRALLLKAVAIQEKTYKPDHPSLANSYFNIAMVEQELGNLSAVRTLLLKAVTILEKTFEPNHPSLIMSYYKLAEVETNMGDLHKAQAPMQKVMALMIKAFKSDHPSLSTSLSEMLMVLEDQDNLEESTNLQTKYNAILRYVAELIAALRYQVEQLGRNDLYLQLAHAETKQGQLLQKLGRLAEAESCLSSHLAIIRHLVNDEGRTDLWNQMNISLSWLGSVLEEQGKLVELRACHRERVAILQRLLAERDGQCQERDLAESPRWQYVRVLYELAYIEDTLGLYPTAKCNLIDLLEFLHYPNLDGLAKSGFLSSRGTQRREISQLFQIVLATLSRKVLATLKMTRNRFPTFCQSINLHNQKEIAASWLPGTISRLCDVLIEGKEFSEASGWVREFAKLPMAPPEQAGHVNLELLKLYQLQGSLAMEQQRYDEAVAWFRQGLERAYHAKAAGQTEAGPWADSFQYRLAQALYEARLPESKAAIEVAISCCRKRSKETTQDSSGSFLARSLMLKARSLLESKESDAALPLADEAQTLLRPLADKTWLPRKFLAECQQLLADIYETLDETETANHLREVAAATLQLPKEWEL